MLVIGWARTKALDGYRCPNTKCVNTLYYKVAAIAYQTGTIFTHFLQIQKLNLTIN